jgi:hypothetical protein
MITNHKRRLQRLEERIRPPSGCPTWRRVDRRSELRHGDGLVHVTAAMSHLRRDQADYLHPLQPGRLDGQQL